MNSWLIVEEGPISGGSYRLRQGVLTIGRGPANPIQIVHPSVSRRHAQLRLVAAQYIITDLMSRNGTYVNSQRISEPTALNNGDVVQVGDIVALYLIGKGPEDQVDLVLSWKKASDTTRIARTSIMRASNIDADLTIEADRLPHTPPGPGSGGREKQS
jgi:pSer/pThr/pTyr-binding forkhead associated (FHA) protein